MEWRKQRKALVSRGKKLLRFAWYTAPLFLGTHGYLQLWPGMYLDSLYAAVGFYGGSCSAEQLNIWLELARWWGLAATGSGLVWLVRPLRDKAARLWIRLCKGTIIYGSDLYAEKLAEDISEKEKGFLKQVLLEKGDKVNPAGRQIIMRGSGTENLLFYEKNRESLRESQVYLNIETIYPDGAMPREVNVFSISESIARIYWKRYPVFPCRGEDKTKKLEIGLIGFDNLGQNLLSYGLLQNIYSEKQTIIYHIWGAGDRRFLHLHRIFQEWQKDTVFPDGTGDRVIFHGEDWDSPQGLSGICQLNRLILCQDHGNDKLLTRLMFLLSAGEVWTIGEKEPGIHVKFGCGESCGLAEEMKGAVQFFGRYEETVTKENIIQEALLKEAKMLHWQYEKRKNGVANNTALSNDSLQAAEQAWKSLPRFFDRYSNIAAADYKTVLKRLLQEHERADGVVTDEDKAGLAALEHIRWCRFHWWNNWILDASLHQKAENERKHPWLRPYGSLPKEIQQYDLDRVNECLEELDRDHQNNEM